MYDAFTVWASQLSIPWLTTIAVILNDNLFWLVLVAVLAAISEKGGRRFRLLAVLGIVYLLGTVLKFVFLVGRPCAELVSKVACPPDPSFPSGHAILAFALAAGLWKRKNGWLFLLFAFFIAFTRVYLGVHTLADVAGGAFFGVLAVFVLGALGQEPSRLQSAD